MKITIHSLGELYELAEIIARGMDSARPVQNLSPEAMDRLRRDLAKSNETVWTDVTPWDGHEPKDVPPPPPAVAAAIATAGRAEPAAESEPSLPEEAAEAPELDASGRRWDARIDSSNRGLNKDGTWRARRNHGLSDEEVEAIKAEAVAAGSDASTEDAAADAPAVTETHPLPVDEPEDDAGKEPPVPLELPDDADDAAEPGEHDAADAAMRADFAELVEAAQVMAGDVARDGLIDVLRASQEFIKAHSVHTFELLKQAVAPEDSTLPKYSPGQRRLLLAAIELHNSRGAA